MSTQHSDARRQFLHKLTAVVGGTATLAASSVVQAAPVASPETEQTPAPASKGYQQTEHVDTYYQLADF